MAGVDSPMSTATASPGHLQSNDSLNSPQAQGSAWDQTDTGVKIGTALGVIFFVLGIMAISFFFWLRFRRRKPYEVEVYEGPHQHPTSCSAIRMETPDTPSIANIPNLDIKYLAPCSVLALDPAGIRWPERVSLSGDAQEIHEWTIQYERDYKKRLSMERGV